MKLTLPLTLTLLRVAAIPVVLLLFYWPVPYARQAATVLYALAAFTDWLDGCAKTRPANWLFWWRSSLAVKSPSRRCASGWPNWGAAPAWP